MSCAKVLAIGAGGFFGLMMMLDAIGGFAPKGTQVGTKPSAIAPRTLPSPVPTLAAIKSDKQNETEVDRSTRAMLAVSIILNGHGCQKVTEWNGDGAAGVNMVTCVERKGRSKLVRYKVDPLEGVVVPL